MLCCSRADHSSTVILKSNMFSMIYNVWSWYDVKITQNYLLVLFLIIMYSQDYKYTLKYSYGHYMVFIVCVTIFSVLQFLFCLQLFIFWVIITTLIMLHLQTWKYQSVDSVFWKIVLLFTDPTYFWYKYTNFNPIFYWNGFFINLLYLMSGNIFFCMKLGVLLCKASHNEREKF
jgi:hypothetical protein